MQPFFRALILATPLVGFASFLFTAETSVQAGESEEDSADIDEGFPRSLKYLMPPPVPFLSNPDRTFSEEHVAYGAVNPEEELEQPIAYSHKLHAGTLQIECEYCHTYARRSIHAGIPSTQICMNCHGEDPLSGKPKISVSDRDELLTLLTFYYGRDTVIDMLGEEAGAKIPATVSTAKGDVPVEQGNIPWVKVHDLPDFVHFSHKRHVTSGVVCQECHGEVQDDMTVARRQSELTMGWCLNCHESHPSIEENYCDLETLPPGEPTCQAAELRRTEIKDCWNCHK